jgi:hypothetical protein
MLAMMCFMVVGNLGHLVVLLRRETPYLNLSLLSLLPSDDILAVGWGRGFSAPVARYLNTLLASLTPMALLGIQLVALLFAVALIYLSFVHLKRREFAPLDFGIWGIAALAFLLMTLFPRSVDPLVRSLALFDTLQLIMIAGMAFITVLVFFLYHTVRRSQQKLERLVTSLALAEGKRRR